MPAEKSLTPKMHGVDETTPHRVTNDELYRRSTQYRYWSFTKDELIDLRVKVNKRGEEIFEKRIGDLSDDLDMLIKKYVAEDFKKITSKEENEIVVYYARKCQDLSNFFKFTTQVRLTAISYLFKFYLVHSIMEYYPQQIMYTCLFLSAKSENNFIGIKNFSKAIPKTTPESILKYEYLILDTMRFSLTCHHPMRPLYGFYLDIQNVLTKLDFARLCKDYESCKAIINESVFTDAQFLFTPPQIALAALYSTDDVVCMRYLMRKFGVKRKQMLEVMSEREKDKVDGDGEGNLNGDTVTEAEAEAEADAAGSGNGSGGDGVVRVKEESKADEEVKQDKEKALTPVEQFEKVMGIIKSCSELMQKKIDPSVQEAKIISLRSHFCLDPVKYFKKITKDQLPSVKRELDVDGDEPSKRLKTE